MVPFLIEFAAEGETFPVILYAHDHGDAMMRAESYGNDIWIEGFDDVTIQRLDAGKLTEFIAAAKWRKVSVEAK